MSTESRTQLASPIVGIAGWKKSGKTTLAVRLVEEFSKRGLRVATIKHAHHDFQIDTAETDSARHRRAGAAETAVVSGKRWAIVHDLIDEPEPDFEEVVSCLSPADLILVEGYKSAPIPKIEARRSASITKRPLADNDPLVFAIAADHPVEETRLPVFALDDVVGLADLITQRLGLNKSAEKNAEARVSAPMDVRRSKTNQ